MLVCEGRHGNIAIEYRGRALRWKEIAAPTRQSVLAVSAPSEPRVPTALARRKWAPAAHHPWRKPFCRAEQKRQRELPAGRTRPSLS